MDAGVGYIAQLSEDVAEELERKGVEIFKVDDIVDLKGAMFKINQITKDSVVLKLVSIEEKKSIKELISKQPQGGVV